MADKLTQLITEALTRAAAESSGLPLYGGKSDPGLFVSTSQGKSAAQKCLTDGYILVVGTDSRVKTTRELYGLTEKGWNFLLVQVNPKQVLEDFVRVLEARSGEVDELLDLARRMANSLQGLKEAVTRVLPAVIEGRVDRSPASNLHPHPRGERELGDEGQTRLGGEANQRVWMNGSMKGKETAATAILEPSSYTSDLADAILSRLGDWSGTAGEDCPLPRLFHLLSISEVPPSIGEFHDCLRRLHAEGSIYLHPWTGPLYALPEPAYALLAGHNIAYYASLRPSSSVNNHPQTLVFRPLRKANDEGLRTNDE